MTDPRQLIPDITGVILAGGKSRRFGSDKALALLDGKPLIEHVTGTLQAVFRRNLVVANNPASYCFLNLTIIPDIYPGAGPLAGIHAALDAIRTEWAFVIACDMPHVPEDLVRLICSFTRRNGCDGIVPAHDNKPEPLCAVYHKRTAAIFAEHIEAGRLAAREIVQDLNCRLVSGQELRQSSSDFTFPANINTREELQAAAKPETAHRP